MSERTPEDVLDYYGSRVPVGISEAAFHRYSSNHREPYPRKVVTMRENEGGVLGDVTFSFNEVHQEEGVLVRKADGGSWVLEDDVVSTCVARLVKVTDFIVTYHDEDFFEGSQKQFHQNILEDNDVDSDGGLESVGGVGKHKAKTLRENGYETVADLREASQRELSDVWRISQALAARIKADVGYKSHNVPVSVPDP